MITYMWDLIHDTNELIQETEMDSQTQKANLCLPKGKAGKCLGLADTNYNI